MSRLNQNVAGITLTSNVAPRDVVKSGHASIPLPRKTTLNSKAVHTQNGVHVV